MRSPNWNQIFDLQGKDMTNLRDIENHLDIIFKRYFANFILLRIMNCIKMGNIRSSGAWIGRGRSSFLSVKNNACDRCVTFIFCAFYDDIKIHINTCINYDYTVQKCSYTWINFKHDIEISKDLESLASELIRVNIF